MGDGRPAKPDRFFPWLVEIGTDTDLKSIAEAARTARRLQFRKPLPQRLLDAIADAVRDNPDVELRVYQRDLDPSLGYLRGFEHVQRLSVDSWYSDNFQPLAKFTNLRRLGIAQTKSTRPSLDFLRNCPKLESLYIEGHDRGFEAVGELPNLRALSLRASRVKSLECLVGHPALERISISFGGLRDLRPLATIPTLRDVSLHRIRLMVTEDLKPLAECAGLDALEIQNLPNLTSLGILGHSHARFLSLEGLTLDSLGPLANWARLRNLMLVNTLIGDQQISPLLRCGDLRHVSVGHARRNVLSDEDVRAFWRCLEAIPSGT